MCDGPAVRIEKLPWPWIALVLAACHATVPPAQRGRPAEGHVQGDGAALFYRMVGAGPDVLVMIHGGPGMDMGYMVPDFGPLAEHHRLLFYDQRGGGRSEHESGNDSGVPQLAH